MENGKKGVIQNKKVIIKPRYQGINYYNVSDVFIVNKNGKYGFFDSEGDEILSPEYTTYSLAGNYISVKKGNDMMLYDLHGNLVNTNTYSSISEAGESAFFIAKDDKGFYSIISKDVQIQNSYTNITYAFDNFFVFTTEEGTSGVLDLYTGTEVEAEYDYIIVLENANALEARKGTTVDIYSKNIEKNCKNNTAIYLEIGINQKEEVINIFRNFKFIKSIKDYGCVDRILLFRK